MDISQAIAELKKTPGFTENVGMVLVHNGVVRGWSRSRDHAKIAAMEITPDRDRIADICTAIAKRPGIFRVLARAESGLLHPGDDALFLIVAGDIREHVKPALADLLDRVKSEAMGKREIFA